MTQVTPSSLWLMAPVAFATLLSVIMNLAAQNVARKPSVHCCQKLLVAPAIKLTMTEPHLQVFKDIGIW